MAYCTQNYFSSPDHSFRKGIRIYHGYLYMVGPNNFPLGWRTSEFWFAGDWKSEQNSIPDTFHTWILYWLIVLVQYSVFHLSLSVWKISLGTIRYQITQYMPVFSLWFIFSFEAQLQEPLKSHLFTGWHCSHILYAEVKLTYLFSFAPHGPLKYSKVKSSWTLRWFNAINFPVFGFSPALAAVYSFTNPGMYFFNSKNYLYALVYVFTCNSSSYILEYSVRVL